MLPPFTALAVKVIELPMHIVPVAEDVTDTDGVTELTPVTGKLADVTCIGEAHKASEVRRTVKLWLPVNPPGMVYDAPVSPDKRLPF